MAGVVRRRCRNAVQGKVFLPVSNGLRERAPLTLITPGDAELEATCSKSFSSHQCLALALF